MLRSCLLALLVLVAGGEAAATVASKDAPLEGLDAFITEVMKEWKVPGLAVAVIHDGKLVLARGYGFRDVERKLPVTPHTLFAIGSITKSFTATGLGMLIDEGKLNWDTPVREYLPDFRLQDPVASEHMTPRDLVTHRSGLPRHDALWYGAPFHRPELFARLRYLEPTKDFRSNFQYQNLMFMTAGYLTEKISGTPWEAFTRSRILEPLEMARSNFSVNDSQKADDFALPYNEAKGDVQRVPFRNIDEIGPAGSINSSVEEMIHYVQFHIDQGKVGERELLSAANAAEIQAPQVVVPGSLDFPEVGHSSYGLGLGVGSYRGRKLVTHGGGIDGFISHLSFMPQEKAGMIILTNLSGTNPVTSIVAYNLYDRLLGVEPAPWAERIRERQKKARDAEEEAKKKGYVARREGTRPSHDLGEYAGAYEHPGYGRLTIDLEGPSLKATFNAMSTPLRHFHYDVFEAPEDPRNPLSETKLTFLYNKKGEIDRLAVPLEPAIADIVFRRAPDESMRKRSFLEPLVGQYELGPTLVTVALRGEDTLTLTVPRPAHLRACADPGNLVRCQGPPRLQFGVQARRGGGDGRGGLLPA